MTISRTIYTGLSTEAHEFDINEFIMAILLFDNVLVSNPGIIPYLVRAIGKDGLVRLVDEGRLSVGDHQLRQLSTTRILDSLKIDL